MYSMPPELRQGLLRGYRYQVEKDRSGRAACKRCGDKIPKDEIRVGYPTKDPRGEYGALVQWLHVSCASRCMEALVKLASAGDVMLKRRMVGFEALTPEQRRQLADDLLRPADEQEDAANMEPPALPPPRQLPRHPKPPTMRAEIDLLPFQAEGLSWMVEREADETTRGGILADEMGMGKTLQTISLLLASEVPGPTLVVCPAAAMLQWRNEILRFTEPGALEVDCYYGCERKGADFEGKTKTVVLTTYQTLEADYRHEVNKHKVICQWCGRHFLPEKLAFHQKYFCGPDAQRTEKQEKQARKSDMKTDAVKKMKIGGTETEIVLNPLGAIRGASIQAARRRRSKGPPDPATLETDEMADTTVTEQQPSGSSSSSSKTSPGLAAHVMPFPVSVLPAEAQAALGCSRASGSASGDLASPSASVGSCRGRKRAVPTEPFCQDAGKSPQHPAVSSTAPAEHDAKLTPSPAKPTSNRKRWQRSAFQFAELKQSPEIPVDDSLKPQDVTPCCPAGHKLVEYKSVKGDPHDCDGCGVTFRGGTILHGCNECDYDLCRACVKKPKVPENRPCVFWGHRLRPAGKVLDLDDGGSDSDLVVEDRQGEAHEEAAADEPVNDPPKCAVFLPPRPSCEDEDDVGILDLSRSALFRTCWSRVILDEAHRIKGRTNSTAQAAFALRASKSRFCLSGTPLQNRVGELYSIVRFLRFYPYAHYICSKKGCDCVSLHYRFTDAGYCTTCGHTKMQHRSHFAGTVSTPIKKYGFLGAGKAAMEKLRTEVLDRILLRRTKLERHADINLPPLEVKIRRDALSEEERDFYTSMYMQSRTKFDTYVDSGVLLHNYAHVFDLIMRLRQAVDHPYLIVHGSLRTSDHIPTQSRGDADICALCQDDIDDPASYVSAQCGHAFHRECVTEYLDQAPELPTGGIGCPTCFAPLTVSLETAGADEAAVDGEADSAPAPPIVAKPNRSIMQRIKTSEFKTSTKIEALMQEIIRMQSADSRSKALVFSQFVNFLELIEWRLKREGINSAKLLGSMSVVSRNNIIISFQTDPSLKVLLISLKAGGEGLNLQAADHIYIMDPWWNPASELQAIQRAHRIGQTRPVHATRFVAVDTIEEKIIELQQKKQSVFDCTVGNSNQALSRLTAEDIKFLFNQ